MKQIDSTALAELAARAQASPRRRANLNLHEDLSDPVQRLAIAMEPDTYVRPHRHPQTWELLFPLRGRFVVLHFDAAGRVTGRQVLGAQGAVLENPAGQWHAVLSMDAGGVIFEVKRGPYQPVGTADYAPWSPAESEAGAVELMAWYESARLGERWPTVVGTTR